MTTTTPDLAKLAANVRIPSQHDRVYNEECIFSFDSPESEGGLYVCMEKFVGLGREHVEQYHKRTDNALFLHIKRTKVPKEDDEGNGENKDEEVPEKVSKMAIGVPGGFDVSGGKKKFDVKCDYRVAVLPNFAFYPVDAKEVPLSAQLSAKAIMKAESALKLERLNLESATWEGEEVLPSKHAENLEQLDNGKKIPPKGWKCEKCDLTCNLWLNLTDGSILCGRKFFDGSGGNNHAVDHYAETKHPLAVKLGTITPDGKADVFSYAEDKMVKDPHLAKHLAHFGINVQTLTKTDKSMAELEIDLNQNMDFSAITEAGSKLEPVFGGGLTGMENLGNTCYLNSTMQMLFTIPSFKKAYVDAAPAVFKKANFSDPLNDFKLQMCKLGHSLWSGKYSKPATEQEKKVEGEDYRPSIRPVAFRTMVGKGHQEFSTSRQQDVQEFFTHLCTLIERNHVGEETNAVKCLQFEVEDRIQCSSSGKVKYKTRVEDFVPIPIPLEAAVNKEAVASFETKKAAAAKTGERIPDDQVVRPSIPFSECLRAFLEEGEVANWYSSAIKANTTAKTSCRMRTFPDFLFVLLKKFDLGEDWKPIKLDVDIGMPDDLDLSKLRGSGLQEGEEELQDEPDQASAAAAAEAQLEPDAGVVKQLADMGFNLNGCKRAAVKTKNAGVEAAMNWVMEHMNDADFDAPFVQNTAASSGQQQQGAAFEVNAEHLATLLAMGLGEPQSRKALRETDNNVKRAIDWVFSHPDDDGSDNPPAPGAAGTSQGGAAAGASKLTDGDPVYELTGFISHIGPSVHVGHYVCHLRRDDGQWIIFNDEKVARSEKPPKNLGYIYLYRRKGIKST